jgi:O-antigen/teichoic acid export membrane protein
VGYLRTIVMTMAPILNPLSSALDAMRETERLRTVFLTACKAAFLIGLPVALGFILMGTRFIELWMGPQYAPEAGRILVVLGIAYMFALPHYCISSVLYGLGRHDIMAKWRAVEAIANIVMSVVLVQVLGLVGVALGTLLSHVAIAAVVLPLTTVGVVKVRLSSYYVSTYGRPLLGAIPFGLACYWINAYIVPASLVTFFASVGAAMPLYLIGVWFVALTIGEREGLAVRVGRVVPWWSMGARRGAMSGPTVRP